MLKFRPRIQERRGERQMRGLVFEIGHCIACHHVETRGVLRDPFVKAVGVELFDILSDLGESKVTAILIGRMAHHFQYKRGCRGDLEVGQRSSVGVEIVDREITIRLNDYRR